MHQVATTDPVVVVRHHHGRVDTIGGEVGKVAPTGLTFVDEERLLMKGAVLYELHYDDYTDIYDKLYPAILALWYAHQSGYNAYLLALNREGEAVDRIEL
ncbi:hypothetical protein CSW47_10755 [Thermus scotoductus]|uniref:Uncharacterized protein n=2 Tax=Thermus scotoductus TaxID=37636 RepID=A0A430R4R0_THESC|nr:hypothetical protein CSW47_10755 [Thermus scotoductus]